ncbi:MAG: VCBS repeat-containing protein, partial [Candidatus Rokuibacteriota bacterium]
MAVANYGSHDISILRGHGDGTFQAPLTFATGGRWPVSVAVGDFNGDGRPDLAVVNIGSDARPCCHYDPGNVSVLVGNGDGTFQAPLTFGGGEHPSAVAVGDFNGDGKLDLAVTSYESCLGCTFHGPGRVSVFPGNGDGTFQPPRSFDTGSLPINGDGTFQPAVDSPGRGTPIAVGDFNGDGKLDLAAASPESNTVSVLLGNGDGTFQPAVDSPGRGTPIAVGDFNGDGALDLALATNSQSNTVSVLLGKGDGTFQSPLTLGVGSGPYSAAVGDFNGDGKLDLAVSNSYTATVSILLGNGDGTFLDTPNFPAGNTMPTSVAVGDFNGDGKQDVAVANTSSWVCDPRCHWGSGAVSVLLGNGDGTFRAPLTYAAGSYPSAVVVGDLNGDGVPDVAVANYGSHDISVLLGHGDGTFQAAVNLPAGDFPASVAVGDFNRDGKLDLAVGHYSSSDVSVLLGNGDGTFQPALTFASAATGAVAV